jgi:hypothetical protein
MSCRLTEGADSTNMHLSRCWSKQLQVLLMGRFQDKKRGEWQVDKSTIAGLSPACLYMTGPSRLVRLVLKTSSSALHTLPGATGDGALDLCKRGSFRQPLKGIMSAARRVMVCMHCISMHAAAASL